jgi:hypothetical protein
VVGLVGVLACSWDLVGCLRLDRAGWSLSGVGGTCYSESYDRNKEEEDMTGNIKK